MKNNKKYFFFFLLFISCFIAYNQELPPVQNYTAVNYGAENQNWSISQSNEKYIYVANNNGLLEFNGANWKLYASPNNTILRSVNVIEDKVYTGCYMEFGFWQKDDFGQLIYASISNKLKIPLLEEEDFWNIINFDNFILFQSLQRIYIYNTVNESFNIIESKTNLPKVFKVDRSIYFQKMNEGVYEIENGNPVLISNSPVFKSNILVNIFSVNNKLLFQTQDEGFYFLEGENVKKWNILESEGFSLKGVYSSTQLADGSFVIGTISDGVYHISKKGELLHIINQQNGLNNNTVLAIFEDQQRNIWLGLDNGISVVNFSSPFSVYNDIYGKLGTVYASAIFNNYLYLGTNQGLFYKKINSNSDFSFIKGTNGQVWFLKEIDNKLFCGHNSGTFLVNNEKATLIVDKMGSWDIKPIPNKPNLLLQGNYDGLNVLQKIDNKWSFRNKIGNFNISSKYFEFLDDDQLFVSHEYKGVYKLKVTKDYYKALTITKDTTAPEGLKSSLITYNNNIIYSSKEGVYKYNFKQGKFDKDPVLTSNLLLNESYVSGKLVVDKESNTLWGFTNNSVVYFSQGKLNNVPKVTKISLPATLRGNIFGYESITHLSNQQYLFGTSRGYIILDLDKLYNKEFDVKINSIEKSILNTERSKVSLLNDEEFNYNENNLYFTYSVPVYDKYAELHYQFQLEGMYNEWSNWSTDSNVSFENLPFGDYTFNVKAKIGNKVSQNIATYSFSINRPWYISNLSILIYSLIFIAALFIVHNLYKRYYSKQKQKLVEKKQHEFSLTQLENEKVIMKLRNDKLRSEVENKTRELSLSTMSIVKKNELLSNIKSELLHVKDDSKVKPVIKIINNSLNNNSDWELFQEAFNNADRDFLKKLKIAHPSLTPNDLRLCAYLRLNLSSKEIAPLLNISARSVEIKRYRLRKKIDLPHEKSLVEYILEV